MKESLARLFFVCLSAVLLWGCAEPEQPGVSANFSLTLNKVGADYVELSVAAPHEVDMAYVLSTESRRFLTPAMLFVSGSEMKVAPGQVVKISREIMHDTEYFLYAVAKVDSKYSEIMEFQFTTEKYTHTELVNIVDKYGDGFKVYLKIPEETKQRGNVIRITGGSATIYNVLASSKGSTIAYDMESMVANGDPYAQYGKVITKDTTIVMDNWNMYVMDKEGNYVYSEEDQEEPIVYHDPIVPGEPYMFLAGEHTLGDTDDVAKAIGYNITFTGEQWMMPAWYDVNAETEDKIVGAFDKKFFKVQEPTLCDATVDIEIENVTVTDATVHFTMSKGVSMYFYCVLDDSTYRMLISQYFDGNEDWIQWFLTSWHAAKELGIMHNTENATISAGKQFINMLEGGKDYHVLCTVLGDEAGLTQRFVKKTFTAKRKTMEPPVIKVEAVDTGNPYYATFKVTAPNKDVKFAYYACNYAREFEMYFNTNKSYEDILLGNNELTAEEISKLNSDEGLIWNFNTLDGEVTRFAIYGRNEEWTYNMIDRNVEGEGWADYVAPMAKKVDPVESDLYEKLSGDWTATATLSVKEIVEDTEVSYNKPVKSKVRLSMSMPELPALTEEEYELYTSETLSKPKTKDEVDKMYAELKSLSDRFAQSRMVDQNRLLCTGFIDFDYYTELSRLAYKSPYQLFVATDYTSYDVPMIVYDFGPKWFMEVREEKDEKGRNKVIVPFNSLLLPPMTAWPSYPFYVGAVGATTSFMDANDKYPGFPVTISDDYNTLTINPIHINENILGQPDKDGKQEVTIPVGDYYMNAIGMNNGVPEVIAKITTPIVLTRGWEGQDGAKSGKSAPARAKAKSGKTIKSMTDLNKTAGADRVMQPMDVITLEDLEKMTDNIRKRYTVK